MYVESGLQVVGLYNILVWLVLLLAFGSVNAEARGAESKLQPRLLPRDQLVSLPIYARDVGSGTPTASGDGTANITHSSAGWSAVTQANDASVFALIRIGGLNFRVVLDTGSTDLWVLSSACTTADCQNLPKYPLSYHSPTFQSVNGNATFFNLGYFDTTMVSGIVARETVELAGLVVANQAFGLISSSNSTLSGEESGILGLGFPRNSAIPSDVNGSFPFFSNLAQQGLLDYPLFGLYLAPNLTGSLSLGSIDASVVTDPRDISWNEVAEFSPVSTESNMSSYAAWMIPLTSFGVNGTQLVPLPSQARATNNISLAVFDLGTAGLMGSYPEVARLYNLIDGARLVDEPSGQWVVPCDTTLSISFTFGSRVYILQPSDYLMGPAEGNPNLCFSLPQAFPPGDDGMEWIMGTAFLQTVYTIFSYGIDTKESPKIGIYPLNTQAVMNNATAGALGGLAPSQVTPPLKTLVEGTLPNSLLSTPTFTTLPYAFNTSVPASIGGLVNSGLATSTYKAILAHAQESNGFNASAIPTISPTPFVITITTDGKTTTETLPVTAVPLGLDYQNAGSSLLSRVEMTCVIVLVVQVLFALSVW